MSVTIALSIPKWSHHDTQGTSQAVPESEFLQQALQEVPKLHHQSHTTITLPGTAPAVGPISLLFQTANACYDHHRAFSLAPEVVWLTILGGVAQVVKDNPAEYAHLFTSKPDEKQTVEVFVDHFVYGQPNDWTSGISQFDEALRKLVPDGIMDRTLLKFSTSTPVTDVAILTTFMDAASPFFDYRMTTRCGIPNFRLEGTPDDWKLVRTQAAGLAEVFGKHLGAYFSDLLPVLDKLVAAADGEKDLHFWHQFYKRNDGSGGPYINGWITSLLSHQGNYKGNMLLRNKFNWKDDGGWGGLSSNGIPSMVGQVPFIWKYLGNNISMRFITGVIGVDFDGEFYSPRVGFAVVEGAKAIEPLKTAGW